MGQFLAILLLTFLIIYGFKYIKEKREKSFPKKYKSLDDDFNERRKERQDEIDSLLDKIGKHGIEDLTPAERERLNELSKK